MASARLQVLLTLAVLSASTTARADPPPLPRPFEWKPEWSRFRPAEYGLTLSAGALTPLVIWALPTPPPGWHRPLLFDGALRNALALDSRDARHRAQLAADVIQYALVLYPLAIDAALTAWLIHGDFDVAAQLALIDVEAFVLQGLLVTATKRTIGRARPATEPCPEGGYGCRSNSQRRSFISGHAAAAFTGAGLICLHHRQVPLYGSTAADQLACATGLALAVADGVLRIASDDHWATDVLASGAIGLVAGYVLPYLLHYAPPGDGRLDGMLHLGAIAGVAAAPGETRFATGVAADARQFWWWNDAKSLGLEVAASALLAGTRQGHFFREGRGSLRLWASNVALGPAVAYRAEVGPRSRDGEDQDQLAGGASLAFGLLEEEMQIVLETTWLPLGGRRDLVEAALEVAAFRHAMIALRIRRPIEREGAFCLLSLGGRLPW